MTSIASKFAQLDTRNAFFFNASHYPPYEHRRTLGYSAGINDEQADADDESFIEGAKTYVFEVRGAKKKAPKPGKGKAPEEWDAEEAEDDRIIRRDKKILGDIRPGSIKDRGPEE